MLGVTLLGWELKATLPKPNGAWNSMWEGLVGKFLQGNSDPEQAFNLLKTVIPSEGSVQGRYPASGTRCRDVEQSGHASDGKSSRRFQGYGQVSILTSEDSFGLLHVGDPPHDLQIPSRAEPKQILGTVSPPGCSHLRLSLLPLPPMALQLNSCEKTQHKA